MSDTTYDVRRAILMRIQVSCDSTPCLVVNSSRLPLKEKTLQSFETSISIEQATRRNIQTACTLNVKGVNLTAITAIYSVIRKKITTISTIHQTESIPKMSRFSSICEVD
jgi:hypothetical protein